MPDFSRWKTPGWAFSDALVNNVPSYTERQQNERELALKALADKAAADYNAGYLKTQQDRLAFDMDKEAFDQDRLSRGGGGGPAGSLFFKQSKDGDHAKTDRAKTLDSILDRLTEVDKDGNPKLSPDNLSYRTKQLLWEYQREAADYGYPVDLPAGMQGYSSNDESDEGYVAPALEGDMMPVETPGGTSLGSPKVNPRPATTPGGPSIEALRQEFLAKKFKYQDDVEEWAAEKGVSLDVVKRW